MKSVWAIVTNAFDWWFGAQCDKCQRRDHTVHDRRQNTAYVDDALNWHRLCAECQAEEDEYWDERWQEYNSGRL